MPLMAATAAAAPFGAARRSAPPCGGGYGEGEGERECGLQTLRAIYILVLATGSFGLVGWTFFTEAVVFIN